jgi:hypothetical protein
LIGNVPLAVLLWKGGMSFGGVTAFMYADLLILPILNTYRKYYGSYQKYWAPVWPPFSWSPSSPRWWRRLRRRVRLRRPGTDPQPGRRQDSRGRDHLELHDLARHRVPAAGPVGAGGAPRAADRADPGPGEQAASVPIRARQSSLRPGSRRRPPTSYGRLGWPSTLQMEARAIALTPAGGAVLQRRDRGDPCTRRRAHRRAWYVSP